MHASGRRRLVLAALVLTACGGFALAIGFQWGGSSVSLAVDDFGEAVAAFVAAGAAAVAAGGAGGRTRLAWSLIGASALVWAVGEVAWSYMEVVLGVLQPFPSVADLGFLPAYPLAVAGLLTFPTAPSRHGERVRALLDGLIAGCALLVVSWATMLPGILAQSTAGPSATALALAYPAGDIGIVAIALLVLSRTPRRDWAAVLLVASGFGAIALSDSVLALTAVGGLDLGQALDAGWVAGFLLVALAALAPGRQTAAVVPAPSRLRVTLPYLPVPVAVAVAGVAEILHGLDPVLSGLLIAMMLLTITSLLLGSLQNADLLAGADAAAAAAHESRDQLERVLDSAPVGIFAVDGEGRIIFCQGQALDQLGVPLADLLGQDALLLVRSRPELVEALARALAGEVTTAHIEVKGRPLDVLLQPQLVDGRVQGFSGVVVDVSAREEVVRVRRESAAKSHFLSTMSHELRTPLNAILGFGQLLTTPGADDLSDRQSRYVGHMMSSGEHLLALINDFLDLSKVAAGEMTVELARVELLPLLEESVAEIRALATERNLDLTLEAVPPAWVRADRRRLFQVMLNLLSNAIKFTPEGGRVCVRVKRGGGSLHISVVVTGIGIVPEDQERIFHEFTQLAAGPNRTSQGTGLGLALSRRLVDLMGGGIRVESQRGQGSVFTVSIPGARRPRVAAPAPEFATLLASPPRTRPWAGAPHRRRHPRPEPSRPGRPG